MTRETLTREKIVRTAVELLDEQGLAGLRMRNLGDRLGTAATTMYWHIGSKDNLLVLASEASWTEIPLPDLEKTAWRDCAADMARGQYAMLTRHPWLVQAMSSQVLYGPAKARHDDHNLAVYELAGFAGAEADRAAAIVFMFVLGSAFGASASAELDARLRRLGGDPRRRLRELVAHQKSIAMQFPRLRARLETVDDGDYYGAPEKSFEMGLDDVLDGLGRQLAEDARRRDAGDAGDGRPGSLPSPAPSQHRVAASSASLQSSSDQYRRIP